MTEHTKHYSLIDAGLSNIWSQHLPGDLESLSLHGNCIKHISNLSHLLHLVHLDLSANQISVIDGLEKLTALKTLNLSCNLITVVTGLSGLRSLESLNLSYNQVENLTGLQCFSERSYHLSYLSVHGNKLRDVKHVIKSLKDIQSLHHLVLRQEGSANPLCFQQGYEKEIWSNMPQLKTLNNFDKAGNYKRNLDSVSNVLGLESFLDFLLLSDKEQESQPQQAESPVLITPKIDAVIEQFKQRYNQETSSSPDHSSSSHLFSAQNYSPKKVKSKKMLPKKDLNNSHSRKLSSERNKKKAASESTEYDDESATISSQPETQSEHRKKPVISYSQPEKHERPARAGGGKTSHVTRPAQAGQQEDEFLKNLVRTLEAERERRWKAEEATRRLLETLKAVKAQGRETETMKSSALEATVELKKAVINEHETNLALQAEIAQLRTKTAELKQKLLDAENRELRCQETLKEAEKSLARKEAEDMTERVHQNKKLQEAQHRASSMTREVELLKHSLDSTKSQLHQLQETLALRENQHKEELKDRFALNSPELQQMLKVKVQEVERSFQAELVKQQEKVEVLGRQYTQLEDEFRYALQMEETRFREIKSTNEALSHETTDLKQLLLAAQRKDESSTSMITELTALVKEQKGRLAELAKCKQEQTISYKERIESLEDELGAARKQLTQLELLRQKTSKLQSTIQAQESVIEGLKAERKLWGQELAHQGASLAQDRGRLEVKIETLASEVSALKKQLEREVDTVKIKTKMVDDQTETIRKLKEALVERDETIRATREENLAIQRTSEEQQTELRGSLEETRELLDRATGRKQELKEQVNSLQQELDDTKKTYSSLSARWKDKSELIGRLEQQVRKMKDGWALKEVQLSQDRDAALQHAKELNEKLKHADDVFRQQIDLKEATFQEKITRMELEKQKELDLANEKVLLVEEEMRQMLRETEATKRAMENKVKKLTQALGDLQTDLYN
ncbi:leucine-rich repeat and coiled-coil domain-containing protein 1-like [Physella acuta]|uniref:leucine-rich repeat and coiled-coil domain-containing protein 1-like n=1 Tax=Physella acuta TaxID=109671 RepID=UPI0027DC4439|nr:leucine-rich repeat and coiled-coil domain-containing protein 1-like [Physella acuta]XP_059163543.1 leucine-rich repeat and coiled-coil domain-containing protein 1-like [Physella acuta]XP_059163544.1 leucine-rich repeat and coiled-coil domain-containing protein 1-like [Physella acuta]